MTESDIWVDRGLESFLSTGCRSAFAGWTTADGRCAKISESTSSMCEQHHHGERVETNCEWRMFFSRQWMDPFNNERVFWTRIFWMSVWSLRPTTLIWKLTCRMLVNRTSLFRCSSGEMNLDPTEDLSPAEKNRVESLQSQRVLSNQVMGEMNALMSLLTSGLTIYLNIGQNFTLNSSAAFMSMETLTRESLLNKEIRPIGNARLRLPSRLNLSLEPNLRHSIRVRPSLLSFSLDLLLSVDSRTVGVLWTVVEIFVDDRSFHVDVVDLDRWGWEWISSSRECRSSIRDRHSSRSFVDHSFDVSSECHRDEQFHECRSLQSSLCQSHCSRRCFRSSRSSSPVDLSLLSADLSLRSSTGVEQFVSTDRWLDSLLLVK